MSSLVLDLQKDALDPNVRVSDLLRKALVVAKKLKVDEFEKWINAELNGYKDDANIPEYRKVQGQIKGFNPFRGWEPVLFQDVEMQEMLSNRNNGQCIAEIEDLLTNLKEDSIIQMPFPAGIEQHIRKAIGFDTEITLFIPNTLMARVLDAVRTIVLNWSMKLEEDNILGQDMVFSKEEKDAAQGTEYHIHHFHGNVGSIQIGANSTAHVTQNLGDAEQKALMEALDLVRDVVEKAQDIQKKEKDELLQVAKEIKAEIEASKPNSIKLYAMLTCLATTIQVLASAQPAYQALKNALIPLGITLP